MNRSILGWVVAAVLAVALAGVLVFQVGGGGGTRTAGLGPQEGQGPPPEVAQDAKKIKDEKDARGGRNSLTNVPADKQGKNRLDGTPENSCDPSLPPNVFAEWRNSPNNLNEAQGKASQVYVATVETVANGQPFVADAPNHPGGKDETPTQQVTLRVDESVKGQSKKGETVTIESLGDGEKGCSRVAGDPMYRRGEQYLLLLEEGKGGRPAHVISPEGRFRVAPDKILVAMENNDRMRDVAKQKLEDVLAKLRSR